MFRMWIHSKPIVQLTLVVSSEAQRSRATPRNTSTTGEHRSSTAFLRLRSDPLHPARKDRICNMKFLDEYRDESLAGKVVDEIRRITTKPWVLMEVCGG